MFIPFSVPFLTFPVKFWGEKDPKAIADQTVSLEGVYTHIMHSQRGTELTGPVAHSFFEPQPERDVGVFFMKSIIHDWSDANCKKILTHLRKAAGKDTKLVLAESIIPYACRMPEEAEADSKDCVPGSILKQAPAPLLPNSLTAPMVLLADIVVGHLDGLLQSSFLPDDSFFHRCSSDLADKSVPSTTCRSYCWALAGKSTKCAVRVQRASCTRSTLHRPFEAIICATRYKDALLLYLRMVHANGCKFSNFFVHV